MRELNFNFGEGTQSDFCISKCRNLISPSIGSIQNNLLQLEYEQFLSFFLVTLKVRGKNAWRKL